MKCVSSLFPQGLTVAGLVSVIPNYSLILPSLLLHEPV